MKKCAKWTLWIIVNPCLWCSIAMYCIHGAALLVEVPGILYRSAVIAGIQKRWMEAKLRFRVAENACSFIGFVHD